MMGYLLSREIEKKGYNALPLAASQVIDWQDQKGHISHKDIGIAGIGWIGRNNLLVSPVFGAPMRDITRSLLICPSPERTLEQDCGNAGPALPPALHRQ